MMLDLERLLWRTRGREWDYSFVLRPAQLQVSNWYDFHTEVFSGATPSVEPRTCGGVLTTVEGTCLPFVATAFQDTESKDTVGRPVIHFLVWFPPLTSDTTELSLSPDWGPGLVRALGEGWRTAFAGSSGSEEDLLSRLRDDLKEVFIPDVGEMNVSLDLRISEKKKPEGPRSLGRSRNPWPLVAVGIALLALLTLWLWRQ